MDFIFDTSALLRLLPIEFSDEEVKFDVQTSQQIKKNVEDMFYFIIRHPKLELLVTPLIYSEISSNAYFYCQTILAQDLMNIINREAKIILDIDNNSDILDILTDLAQNYKSKGGADNLIISEAKLLDLILVTADSQQHLKARQINLTTYNIFDSFERRSLMHFLLTNFPIE